MSFILNNLNFLLIDLLRNQISPFETFIGIFDICNVIEPIELIAAIEISSDH